MAVESSPPLGEESIPPSIGGEFEPPREARRRRRRERRAERERTHVPIEPLTIWVRSDPNRLQPQQAAQPAAEELQAPMYKQSAVKHETSVAQGKHEQLAKPVERRTHTKEPKQEHKRARAQEHASVDTVFTPDSRAEGVIPAPAVLKEVKESRPNSMEDMPAQQALPRLDIRPRHFYTEPEVRQPHAAEEEHDILPSTTKRAEQAPAPEPETSPQPPATEHATPEPTERLAHAGERLQEIAAQKAQRAAELERKHQVVEEMPAERREPELTHETKEPMGAVVEGTFESNTRMGHEELLALGESIRIEDVSIAEMFRAGRLDEEGLRRIVVEFLRGQRIEKTVAEEVLRQQMRFERDPQLRQVPVAIHDEAIKQARNSMESQQRKVFSARNVRRQADRIADSLADGIDRAVEAAENNPNLAKTVGGTLAVIIYFVVLILIIRS